LHNVLVGHALPEELCVIVAARQRMQSPGSILGFAGTNIRLTPLPIKTVGVLGDARLTHAAGVAPNAQLGVMQAVCADAGAESAIPAVARAKMTGMDARERDMA
jgi:hypothetical protein